MPANPPPPSCRYPVEECDVMDRAALVTFREKRLEWSALLEYGPQHKVSAQLSALLWQDAAFRLFNEIRRLSDSVKPATVAAPLVAEELDNAYVTGPKVSPRGPLPL